MFKNNPKTYVNVKALYSLVLFSWVKQYNKKIQDHHLILMFLRKPKQGFHMPDFM